QTIGRLPLILNIDTDEVCARLACRSKLIDRVVAVLALWSRTIRKTGGLIPVDVHIPARISVEDIVDRVPEADPALQIMETTSVEILVVVGVHKSLLRRVVIDDFHCGCVLRELWPNEVSRLATSAARAQV